jgi:preprotein translocase subunit SecF
MFTIFVGTRFDFMGKRRMAYVLSVVLVLASIASLVAHGGPRESIDFTGGTLLDVGFSSPVPVGDVRAAAEAAGITGAEIQMISGDTDAILRFAEEHAPDNAFVALEQQFSADHPGVEVTLRRTETVGPKVGKELEAKAAQAILWSLVLMLGYIALRFRRFSFGFAAVIALFHDIVITLGVFSLFNIEVSLTVVAALLTIGGYSINDTIVLLDRIRENRGLVKRKTFVEVVNLSVNQTLSRTFLTSLTTLAAVLALYLLGGIVIHDFAFAMLIGVVVGTYSSIFVASALAVDISGWWERRRGTKAPAGKPKAVVAG